MQAKKISMILILASLVLMSLLFALKEREDQYINTIITMQGGICFLEDGTCLHEDRSFLLYYLGAILVASLLGLGIYNLLFDKTQKLFLQQQKEVVSVLKEAKEKDEFHAYLAGFSEEEQKVLKAVQEQEGIQQSTLRYRTGIAKTSLSLLLKSLEERGIITKKEHGKTNQVFLVKKF